MIYPVLSSGFECNCYLVVGKKTALVDAGNPKGVLEKARKLSIGINYLLTTHCHFDHVSGLVEVKEKSGCLVAVHEKDASSLESGDAKYILSDLFFSASPKVCVEIKLKGGEVIDLGGVKLEVIHTPGHTPGGICLYEPGSKSLFSGDTVFADSVGRTDFPGGSMDDLKKSLEKLLSLHEERGIETIYPGHGPLGCGEELEGIYREYF